MKIATLDGRTVITDGEHMLDVGLASAGRFGPRTASVLEEWDEFVLWALDQDLSQGAALDVEALGAPVPEPRQVFALGHNYAAHAQETGRPVPQNITVFTKFQSSLAGPFSTVDLPEGTVDFEAELVAVIGRSGYRIEVEDGWDHVAGPMVGQDLSERLRQNTGSVPQFSLAKSHPGFSPTGPWVVTPDEVDRAKDLSIGCSINGEVMQNGRTSDLVFHVAELIARLSEVVTLLPGDLVFTGTPAGVGVARDPQRFLVPGDVLETWIEGIGSLRTICV